MEADNHRKCEPHGHDAACTTLAQVAFRATSEQVNSLSDFKLMFRGPTRCHTDDFKLSESLRSRRAASGNTE